MEKASAGGAERRSRRAGATSRAIANFLAKSPLAKRFDAKAAVLKFLEDREMARPTTRAEVNLNFASRNWGNGAGKKFWFGFLLTSDLSALPKPKKNVKFSELKALFEPAKERFQE